MKTLLVSLILVAGAPGLAGAALFDIDISPSGGALNLGGTTYTQDHAVGLSAANETSPTASLASGNEVGGGITYDDVSNQLDFDFAYGSSFGFVDLGSAFNGGVHIHGPGAVNFPAANTSAGILHNLGAFHTASTATSGRVTGSVVLTATQETQLFDNLLYLNIHSTGVPGGEIRGQLVPVPEPSLLALALLGLAVLGRTRPARSR